jgi:putative FmdB family regulatory protein
MIYPFQCDQCNTAVEVYRPAAESDQPQVCQCGAVMRRVYTAPMVSVDKVEGFDHGLGRYIRNKGHKRDVLRQIKAETGQDLIEVGNEKPKIKPIVQEYDIPGGVL